MKKLISLLLVLVLALGMLSGIAFADYEKPDEVAEADAGVMVTCSANDTKYYFETLTNELIRWACHDLEGNKIITLLKDLDLASTEDTARFLQVPSNMADWYDRAGLKSKLILDLNEKTLSYSGYSNMFYMDRFGMTVKDGTIKYNGVKRHVFVLGGTKTATAVNAGTTVWEPKLVLDNVEIYHQNEDGKTGGAVVYTSQYAADIQINDSVLHTKNWVNVEVRKTSQEALKENQTPYAGDFETTVEISNSTLISDNNYPLECSKDAPGKFIIENSTLVSNAESGLMIAANTVADVDTNGVDPVKADSWSMETAIGTVSGNAYHIGDAPTAEAEILPFADVKESDWFYSFVKELYNKKVVAGQTAITFNPNGNLTYAAALKLLVVGLTGKDPGNASGHWAMNYLNEAKNAGWTDIDASKLDAPITREAFCQIAAKAKNLTEQPVLNPFTDTENTSVLALVNAGVINGMSADKFQPAGILTRAQISKIISLLLKLK